MVSRRKNATYQAFAARLNEACEDNNIPIRGRARIVGGFVGIGYKGAAKWLAGFGMPDMGHASALAIALNVSFEWLMTGRGSKSPGKEVLAAAETTAPYRATASIEQLLHNMPTLMKLLLLKYFGSLNEVADEHPEFFERSKSDVVRLKAWREDYQRLRRDLKKVENL